MKKVIRLPSEVTNKIAAGEVIERPASVIKELVENSIDAGAAKIEMHIFDGGKDKIQIIDDGHGMDREDALLSLERFTTSKINRFDDLEGLSTFGFRGEALA
ncbi:MAG: DNA mismatch repair protein MutL, partial [bacterium]|nr:DNA mismatch repair protein MutL [bacterium]